MLSEKTLATAAAQVAKIFGKDILTFLKESGKIINQKLDIFSGNAFQVYLKRAVKRYAVTKTLLYKNEPKFIYNFFVPVDVQSGQEKIEKVNFSDVIEKIGKQ